jgi:hypothetical protein
MKMLIILLGLIFCGYNSYAQVNKKEPLLHDSAQQQIINKMPMDTLHPKLRSKHKDSSNTVPKHWDDKDPNHRRPKK